MREIVKMIVLVLVIILAILGLVFVGLIVYYWQPISILLDLCGHYPNAFSDCKQ